MKLKPAHVLKNLSSKLLLTSFLMLKGCYLIGPDYERPDLIIPQTWLDQHKNQFAQATHDQWWQYFQDPTLNTLIDQAKKQNLDLQTAALRIIEARARLNMAKGSLFPQQQNFSSGFHFKRESENSANFDDTDDPSYLDLTTGFDAVWELDVWGRFRRTVESSRAQLGSAYADFDDVLVSLTAEVAMYYIDIRIMQQRLKLMQENLKLQQRSLRITRVLFDNGLKTELDMQQAQTLVYATQIRMLSIEKNLNNAQNNLSSLLAKPPGAINLFVSENNRIPDIKGELLTGIPADLLRRRPDVRKQEFLAISQNALIGATKAELLPKFSLRGTIGLNASTARSLDLMSVLDLNSLIATIGPNISWPILNYGRIKNNVRVIDARYQQSILQLQQIIFIALRDVENAMIKFQMADKQVELLEKSVQAAERAANLALIQYQDGIENFVRVINAQKILLQMQDDLAVKQGSKAKSTIALYKALGGGWSVHDRYIIPDETKRIMRERTDWGEML